MYTGERTIAHVHLGYKQPHTLGTQTDLGTSVCTHTRNYKDTPVQSQTQALMYTTCVAQGTWHDAKYCTGTSTAGKSKHVDHRAIGASPRLSMPNAQAIHAQYCTGTSTARESKHVDHHAIDVSRRLSMPNAVRVQYSVRAHARGHDQYIAQAVHAVNCTCTSTTCEPNHAGLSAISLTVRAQV